MINSTTRSKPYFYSSYIPLLQECILSYLGGVDLTKENFHLIKSKFFEIFSKQDSSLLSILQKANSLVIRAPNEPALKKGNQIGYFELD